MASAVQKTSQADADAILQQTGQLSTSKGVVGAGKSAVTAANAAKGTAVKTGAGATVTTPPPAPAAIKYSVVPQNASPTNSPNGTPSILPTDSNYDKAESGAQDAENYYSDPTDEDGLEEKEFQQAMRESQGVIDSTNDEYDSQVEQAKKVGATESSATGSALNAAGLIGSTAAGAALGKTQENTADSIKTINATRATAIQNELDTIRTNAQAKTQTDAQNMIANRDKLKTDATASISNMAKAGMDWQKFKTSFPDEYSHLADSVGGENQAQAIFAMNKTPAEVVSSYTQGSNYIQLTKDPVTGAVSAQTFDLGVTPPTGWVAQKLGTTATVLQDPNNPANTIIYSVDPLSGAVSISGTGTGQDIAATSNTNTNQDPSATSQGAASASTTISTNLGIDPTTPLSDAIDQVGLGPLVQAFIQNEGSSPKGVDNNPGNIKYTGAPGQIDSGVKATDGGTFASYKTTDEGQKAVAKIIQNAADGKSDAYGKNPTLDSFASTYTNTPSASQAKDGSTTASGLPTGEYGLLANVAGFDPKNNAEDSAAANYLNEYMTQGKTPTAASIGISTRTGSGAVFNKVAQRADDLYFKATGQHLPDLTLLTSNKKLLSGNNSILNTLNLQEKTISANSDLLLKNLNASNINQAAPIVNGIIDSVRNALGDPDVASYLAQNATIGNELGSLLALKNATGTTVHDKLESAGIIDKNDNADQIASKIKVLMQEAQNGRAAIEAANESLYGQVDPLGLNPNNPAIQPGYSNLKSAGAQNNYDGTWTMSVSGVDYTVVPHPDGTYTYTKKQ